MAQDIINAPVGTGAPLCFGYVRATGTQFINYTDTGGTMYGAWLLGDDEWDGFDTLWNTAPGISGLGELWAYNYADGSYQHTAAPDPPVIHLHPGTDTPVGSYITTTYSGGDQLCDSLFGVITAVIPMCYSGFAYYMM